jgi:hypothetical protein
MSIRFKKIKHNPKEGLTELAYQKPMKGDYDDYIVVTREEPHPDFKDALQGLAGGLLELCELDGAVEEDQITIRGVSFSYAKDDSVGAVITGLRELRNSNAPLVLNSPHKLLESMADEPQEEQLLPDAVVSALDDLITQALAFLNGKRSQGDLFEGAEATAPTKKEDDVQVTITVGETSVTTTGDGLKQATRRIREATRAGELVGA